MVLPAPDLDDRHFQDLVDDAKRLVQQRCPTWTDHNVSDPGVTLIEAYAQMVDQLIYRLNRVPDRNYVKFLELIDVQLRPPAGRARRGDVLAVGAAAADGRRCARRPRWPRRAPTSTSRSSSRPPSTSTSCRARWRRWRPNRPAPSRPTAPTSSTKGLQQFRRPAGCRRRAAHRPVRTGAVVRRACCAIDCEVAGAGIDPKNPPTVWEAWTGAAWERCEVDSDGTGGLNKQGDIVLHVPRGHAASRIARQQWRLAALPDRRGRGRPAAVPPLAAHQGGDRVHDRRHGPHRARRGRRRRDPRASRPARRRSVSRCSAARC